MSNRNKKTTAPLSMMLSIFKLALLIAAVVFVYNFITTALGLATTVALIGLIILALVLKFRKRK